MATGLITLENSAFELLLDPERGGSVLAFRHRDGREIFRDARGDAVTDSACFAMVPFCNRIRDGRFAWRGQTHELPPNARGGTLTAHGSSWLAAWQVVERSGSHTVLDHRYHGPSWPWPYLAALSYHLDEDALTIALSVTNEGTSSMPAGLGLHPYFPLARDTVIDFRASALQACGDDGFPARHPHEVDLLEQAAAGALPPSAGNLYVSGCSGPAHIRSGRSGGLTMTSSPNARSLALHLEPDNGLFCLEPMTHDVGAFDSSDGSGAGHGLLALAPRQTLSMTVRFEPEGVGGRRRPTTPLSTPRWSAGR